MAGGALGLAATILGGQAMLGAGGGATVASAQLTTITTTRTTEPATSTTVDTPSTSTSVRAPTTTSIGVTTTVPDGPPSTDIDATTTTEGGGGREGTTTTEPDEQVGASVGEGVHGGDSPTAVAGGDETARPAARAAARRGRAGEEQAGPQLPILVPTFVRHPHRGAPPAVVASGIALVAAAFAGTAILLREARRTVARATGR